MDEIRTIHIKKIKEDEIRVINVKKINNENNVKQVKVEKLDKDLKYVEVINLNNYYQKCMAKLKELPDTFLKNYNQRIELAFYYAKASCLPIDDRIKKIYEIFSEINLDSYIKFYDEEVSSKLKVIGYYDLMTDGVYKIYLIHHFVTVENGYSKIPGLTYPIKELRSILLWKALIDKKHFDIKLKRKFAINNGNIVESGESIPKNKLLKGGSVMVEYQNSLFMNIPYYYYKKLLKIMFISVGYDVVDLAMPLEDSIFDNLITTENSVHAGIENLCKFAIDYRNTLIALNLLSKDGVEHLYDYRNDKTTIQYKDGTTTTTNIQDFMTHYFEFLD